MPVLVEEGEVTGIGRGERQTVSGNEEGGVKRIGQFQEGEGKGSEWH